MSDEQQDGMVYTVQGIERLEAEIDRLRAENAKLRAALAFYADKSTWRSGTTYMCSHCGETRATRDRGEKARAAAAALKETGDD